MNFWRRITQRFKKSEPDVPPAFLIAPPVASIPLPKSIAMQCPQCSTHWGNATINFDKEMKRSDFAVREDLKGRFQQQKSGLPVCPACGYNYEPMAILALMVTAVNREGMERKLWKTNYNPVSPSDLSNQ